MPRKVNKDECIGCGACVDTCPVQCITLDEKAEINPEQCIDCGACQDVCPVSAIDEE